MHNVIQNDIDEAATARVRWKIDALPPIEADHVFLHVVFTNIIANAVKFSEQRELPVVEIGAQAGTGEHAGYNTIYFVRDNGAGFDIRYVDKLFGVFQRLHVNEAFEGTGIGLANVRRIIERHGGKIWAEGRPNDGATFYMALPRHFRPESGVRHDAAIPRHPRSRGLRRARAAQGTTSTRSSSVRSRRRNKTRASPSMPCKKAAIREDRGLCFCCDAKPGSSGA